MGNLVDDRTNEQEWQRLVRRARRCAVVDMPSVVRGGYQGRLRMAPGRRAVGLVFSLLGAGMPVAVGCSEDRWFDFGLILAAAIGAFFLLVGMALTIQVGELRWNTADGMATIRWGWWPWIRTVQLRTQDIRPRLTVSAGSGKRKTATRTQLWIRRADEEDEVLLTESDRHAATAAALRTIEEICGHKGTDETLRTLAGLGVRGTDIRVASSPLGTSSANFRDWALRVQADEAAFVSSMLGRAFWTVFTVFGAMALAMVPAAYRHTPLAALLPAGISALFLLVGLTGLLGRLSARPRLVADRTRRTILLRWGPWKLASTVPFENVAAVQVCSQYISGDGDSASYTTYELNLILRDPPGERIGVLSHGNEDAVREDAEAFADFLGVPMLDHAANDE